MKDAGREVDTSMMAIQRDEDYLGDFTNCVKEQFMSVAIPEAEDK